jgi:ABC-type multidrug transport system fused ATPase/permease subunit
MGDRQAGKAMPDFELTYDIFPLATSVILVLPAVYYAAVGWHNRQLFKDWSASLGNLQVLASYLKPRNKGDFRDLVGLLAVTLICVGIVRGINVVSPLWFRRLLSMLSSSHEDQLFPWKEITAYVMLRYPISNAMHFVKWLLERRIAGHVQDRIDIAVYGKLMSLSAEYHDSKDSGSAWITVSSSGYIVTSFISLVCFDMIPNILDLIFAIVTFGSICGGRVAFVMIFVSNLHVILLVQMSKRKSEGVKEWRAALESKENLTSDVIPNWWTVFSFNRVKYETSRYAEAVHRMRVVDIAYCEAKWFSHTVKHMILNSGLLVISLLVSYDIWNTAGRTAGDLMLVFQFWSGVIGPVQRVLEWNDKARDFFANAEKLLEIIQKDVTVKDKEDAKPFQLKDGSIEVRDVTFSYSGKHEPATRNMSLKVEGGQTVAIVGRSGGGKSTLLNLLMRSYDLSSGSILIDGQDIKEVQRESLIEHISIVPQTIGVFNTSILENLRYAKFDATLEECEAACRAVGLHDKISGTFEKGYEEVVGEKGAKLSGGELQRLAIARVILRGSKIVLFDEAMSSLDSETEFRIQEYLREWCRGRTVIIVAHRLASITHANLIIAVKDGEIIERGSQEELLAQKGYFYDLWSKQKLA